MSSRYNFNRYLDSFGDAHKFINDKGRQLASFIYDIAVQEINHDKNYDDYPSSSSDDESDSFVEKWEASQRNMKVLLDLFEKCDKARSRFLQKYPHWSPLRENNVEQLNKIAQTMNLERFNCNVSKLVGGSVGVVGGAALIGTLIFPPAAVFTLPLAIGSGVVTALGGATTFGTCIAEIALLKKHIGEAKVILGNDKKAFKPMEKWFKHTQELIDELEAVIGFDLMKKTTEDMEEIFKNVRNIQNFDSWKYHEKFRTVVRHCVNALCLSGNLHITVGVRLAPIVVALIFALFLLHRRNRLVFNCVLITVRIAMGLPALLDAGTELVRVFAAMALKGPAAEAVEVISKNVGVVALRGIFAGMGIALDIATIVLISIDVHKGSVSEQAVEVTKAAQSLESELKFLNELHVQLRG